MRRDGQTELLRLAGVFRATAMLIGCGKATTDISYDGTDKRNAMPNRWKYVLAGRCDDLAGSRQAGELLPNA